MSLYRRPWWQPPARRPLAFSAAVAASGTIAITTPADGRIHQRSGTTGTITVTGTYTGSPTSIEARIVSDGTSTPLASFDWAVKVASPSAGTYSFSFTSVPQGGWYNVQVRFSNDTLVTATSNKVGVGVLFGLTGQSNAWYWFRTFGTATDPNSLVRVYGNISSWAAPTKSTMAGAVLFGNAIATALSIPVGVLDYASSGTSLYNGWLPVSGTLNRSFTDGVGALDDKLEAVVWIQGEQDAADAQTQLQYYTNLGTLFADWRSAFGQASLPIVLATLGKYTGASYNDADAQAILNAQIQKCADANIYRVDRMDLALSDTVHHTAGGFETLGSRCARAALAAIGTVATYRGPRISEVRQVSASAFDVILTHDMGTDFTPTSGITGFRVLDSGTPVTVSTAVRVSATKIRLTLASSPGSLPSVQYLYGIAPTVTGVVVDNGTLTLPLERNDGVTAQAAYSVTVTLVDTGGSPRASLAGLNWAWFDGITPDVLGAPTDQGTGETTDGSGVFTTLIPNTTKTTGGVGWLIVSDSDGTTTQSPAHRAFAGPVEIA